MWTDNHVVRACARKTQAEGLTGVAVVETTALGESRPTKLALELGPPKPITKDELPRENRGTVSELVSRHSPLVAAALLGLSGVALFAGGAPLQQVDQPPAAGHANTTELLAQAGRVDPHNQADRRALYTAYVRGGQVTVGHTDATPIERPGAVTEYPPTARTNGKTLYFLYGFRDNTFDQGMASVHRATIDDDISAARAKGYKVVVDRQATREDVARAMYDPGAAGIVWVGHGAAGGWITTSDNGFVRSENLDASRVSKNLKFVVLQACHSDEDQGWQSMLGRDKVIAFEGKTRWYQVLDFNNPNSGLGDFMSGNPTELDDLIRTRL